MRWQNEKEGQQKQSQEVKELWAAGKQRAERKEKEEKKMSTTFGYTKRYVYHMPVLLIVVFFFF